MIDTVARASRHQRARALRRCALAVAAALLPGAAAAQVLHLQGGTSSLFGAHGGSIDVQGAASSVSFGAGTLQGNAVFGLRVRRTVRRHVVTFGDDAVDMRLPTDATGATRYMPVRGLGVARDRPGGGSFAVFAGQASTAVGAPFFRGSSGGRPLALLFVDEPRGRWRFTSRNGVGDRLTSIQGLEWRRDALSLAASGGLGAGRPYAAARAHLTRSWLDLRTGYAAPASGFRRLDVRTASEAESEREHVSITLSPQASWSISGSRQHLVDGGGGSAPRATVSHAGGTLNLGAARIGGGVFRTTRGAERVVGGSATLGRTITDRLDAGADVYRTRSSDGTTTRSVAVHLRRVVGPRLNLLAVAARTDRQTSVNLGGQFVSNLATVDVGYQTTHTPFGDRPFVRALTLQARVQVGAVQLTAATYVTPNGSLRYTVSGGLLRSLGAWRSKAARPAAMGRYVVRGRVVDEGGRPVAGAAVSVGGEVLATDDAGGFVLRRDRQRPLHLAVLVEEFSAPGRYQVVSAPRSVTPVRDDGPSCVVVVRRW